jgi:Domain of unknown function (DUF4347)
VGGELLIYGCNLAKGAEGHRFIADLASLTGATVTAATDYTGAFALGGNWHLAARTGALNTAALRIDDYAGLLNLDSVMTSPSLTIALDRLGVDPDNSHYAAQSVVGLPGGGSAVSWVDRTGSSHTGITRPALELDSTGHIILDEVASNFASTYGTKALYAGMPPSTPYPPVADTHLDFHLI